MEDNRRRQQEDLRTRHDKEMEDQKRSRQNIIDSHQRLKGLVEGQGMRPSNEYKPPPHWQPPGTPPKNGNDTILTKNTIRPEVCFGVRAGPEVDRSLFLRFYIFTLNLCLARVAARTKNRQIHSGTTLVIKHVFLVLEGVYGK